MLNTVTTHAARTAALLLAASTLALLIVARPGAAPDATPAIGQPAPSALTLIDAQGRRVTLRQIADGALDAPTVAAIAAAASTATTATTAAAAATAPPPTVATGTAGAAGAATTAAPAAAAKDSTAPALLVVRIQAAWCGTCQWHAGWSAELQSSVAGRARVRIVDLLIADEDNGPPDAATLDAWQTRTGADTHVFTIAAAPIAGAAATANADRDARDATNGSRASMSDPFAALFPPPSPLPRVVLIDARDLTIRAALANPSPDRLVDQIAQVSALSSASTAAVPAAVPATAAGGVAAVAAAGGGAPLVDGRFTRDQWDLVRAMRMPDAPPPDPTNRVADNARAAAFGRTLFFAQTLSPAGRACASCHAPDLLFTNGKDIAAEGVGPGVRNVPTILMSSHARWLLWDGRVDSAWAQAAMPFEDPTEMGSSRLFIAHAIGAQHRADYEALFGPLPPLAAGARFPPAGKPGDAAWNGMQEPDRQAIARVLANVGKALAAYQRSLRLQPTALDRYAGGDFGALAPEQKDGLAAFLAAGCAQCHYGPRLSDDAFHVLRFPTGHDDGTADRGRADGVARLASDEFSRAGAFSDAVSPRRRAALSPAALGAFKTPGLRGVPFTMPYGHGGGFGGLTSVIEAHRTGGLPAESRYAVGETEPWARGFDPSSTAKIVRFLQVLRADVTPASAAAPPSPSSPPASAARVPR